MLEKFIRGKEYQSAKYEEAQGVLELRFGIVRETHETCPYHYFFTVSLFQVNMPDAQLMNNFQALVEQVSTHSQTKAGPFVTGCTVYCPPSTEEFRVDVTPFLPSDDDVQEKKDVAKQLVNEMIKKAAPEVGDELLKALPPIK